MPIFNYSLSGARLLITEQSRCNMPTLLPTYHSVLNLTSRRCKSASSYTKLYERYISYIESLHHTWYIFGRQSIVDDILDVWVDEIRSVL